MSRKSKDKKISEKKVQSKEEKTVVIPDFDTLQVLRTERFDTKPNMSRFLKQYVDTIRISTLQKILLYPKIHYDICRAVIRFKNNTDIIKDFSEKPNKYFMFRGVDEVDLKEKNLDIIEKFFNMLMEFHFIRNGNEDVKVFSTDVEKTNEGLEASIKNS